MLDVCVGQFPSKSLRWAYIGRGDLTEGFLRYGLGGLMFGGAYTWTGLFSEFYGISLQSATAFYYKVRQVLLQSATILLQSATIITKCARTLHEWVINLLVPYMYSSYILRPSSVQKNSNSSPGLSRIFIALVFLTLIFNITLL